MLSAGGNYQGSIVNDYVKEYGARIHRKAY